MDPLDREGERTVAVAVAGGLVDKQVISRLKLARSVKWIFRWNDNLAARGFVVCQRYAGRTDGEYEQIVNVCERREVT